MIALRFGLAALLFFCLPAAGHRLDEYVQACRISLLDGRVEIEVDLTPGVNVAHFVLAGIDTDGDDQISSAEAEAWE